MEPHRMGGDQLRHVVAITASRRVLGCLIVGLQFLAQIALPIEDGSHELSFSGVLARGRCLFGFRYGCRSYRRGHEHRFSFPAGGSASGVRLLVFRGARRGVEPQRLGHDLFRHVVVEVAIGPKVVSGVDLMHGHICFLIECWVTCARRRETGRQLPCPIAGRLACERPATCG